MGRTGFDKGYHHRHGAGIHLLRKRWWGTHKARNNLFLAAYRKLLASLGIFLGRFLKQASTNRY